MTTATMSQKRVEIKTDRVETGWFYAAPAVLNTPKASEAVLGNAVQ